MKKEIILSENELKNLVYKIIKEITAGYDDYEVMGAHAGTSMGIMTRLMAEFSENLINLFKSVESEENPFDSKEFFNEINQFMALAEEFKNTNKIVYKDFSEKELVRKGKILLKKIDTLQENLSLIKTFGKDFFKSNEDFKEKFKNYILNILESITEYSDELTNTNRKFTDIFIRKNRNMRDN